MISKEAYQHILSTFCYLSTDSSPTIRAKAIEALGKMGDTEIVPILVKALKDTAPEVQLSAIQALSQLKELSASKAIFELRKLGENSDKSLRQNVVKALISIGASATNAISVLTGLPEKDCERLIEQNVVEFTHIPGELRPFGLAAGEFNVPDNFDSLFQEDM